MEESIKHRRGVNLSKVYPTSGVELPDTILDSLRSSVDIITELYSKTKQSIASVDQKSDPFLYIMCTMLTDSDKLDVNDYGDYGIIKKRYEVENGSVVTYYTLYDVETRMLLVVNNFLIRRGYDKKYLLKELTVKVAATINDNFISNKDHIT